MKIYVFFNKTVCFTGALALLVFSIVSFKTYAIEITNSPNISIEISTNEKKKFENISCIKFVGTEIDKISAQTVKGLRFPTDVFIDCKPHNNLDGYPLRISVNCKPSHDNWSCEYPALQAVTTMSRQKIVVSSDPDEIHGAIKAVEYLDKSGKFIDSNFLSDSFAENICLVYEFKNSKWSVQCNERWGFDLKQLCDGDKCNFEVVSEGPIIH